MRMRKKPNLAARMEKCAHLLVGRPELLRGRWLDPANESPGCLTCQSQRLFPDKNQSLSCDGPNESGYSELYIELGCGKGRFTIETAKAATAPAVESGSLFVALEKSADAMIIAVERAAAEDLQNVRFINVFADDLTDYFAPGEVSRIYLNFCDPWPSNRHAKRRLTNRRFLEFYLQVLKPGGEVHFKTDNFPLFEYSLQEFEYAGFALKETVRDLHKDGPVGVMTDYEQKFHAQGLPIYKCIARKN